MSLIWFMKLKLMLSRIKSFPNLFYFNLTGPSLVVFFHYLAKTKENKSEKSVLAPIMGGGEGGGGLV